MTSDCCSHQPSQRTHQPKDAWYTCPMHPEVQQIGPGFCPICGMSLDPMDLAVSEDDTEYREMLRRLWISVILTIPVFILSMVDSFAWIQLILSTPVVLWAGWPFFQRAWFSLVNRSLNMFSLIALGVGTAFVSSVVAVILPGMDNLFLYFEAACVITVLVIVGQVLELKAKSQTGHAIKALLGRAAKTAHVLRDGQESDVHIDEVKVGDLLRVKPGEKVPVDGTVKDGLSYVDESMITGESLPVQVRADSKVTGGTINQQGSFVMMAQRVGNETLLARIVQMVSDAQRSRAPIQRLADQIAGYFVPIVILIALVTFITWFFIGPEPRYMHALANAVAVLIIACPCALGLATPMSIMVGVGRGAQMGVLIKNAEALEILEKVNTIVLDKTGTLTEGKPKVTHIESANPDELLRLAAAVEAHSEHPIALAIVQEARSKQVTIPEVKDFQSTTGKGVEGVVEGRKIRIGKSADAAINVEVDGQVVGSISISDPIKESTKPAIAQLHRLGIRVIMLTGDNEVTAKAVAEQTNIDEFYAGVDPKDKHALVRRLRAEGHVVAMVGDGINDAPALAAADVGIAMGTGTDVAMESAGVTLVKGDLMGVVRAIALSKATMKNIRQNLFFAFVYNAAGIPIAAGVLYPVFGLLLNPMIAGAAMALSSVSVITNALRLNRVKL
ncbi:MAG: copper-translocating P-type ATPase [Chlamydiales bacterium]|nr:copper-translocating P-type ATPase [Chlamydiales bacterium]